MQTTSDELVKISGPVMRAISNQYALVEPSIEAGHFFTANGRLLRLETELTGLAELAFQGRHFPKLESQFPRLPADVVENTESACCNMSLQNGLILEPISLGGKLGAIGRTAKSDRLVKRSVRTVFVVSEVPKKTTNSRRRVLFFYALPRSVHNEQDRHMVDPSSIA